MNDAPGVTPAPRPRRTRWWLLLGLPLAALIGMAALVALALHALPLPPVSVTIDGEPVLRAFELSQLRPLQLAALGAGLVGALLAIVLVVPLALVIVLGAIAGAILLAVGLPLLAAGAVVVLLLSPLLLALWLVWKLATR